MTNATQPFDALMNITARPSTVFVKGDGAYLWDDSGKRYLDFMQIRAFALDEDGGRPCGDVHQRIIRMGGVGHVKLPVG